MIRVKGKKLPKVRVKGARLDSVDGPDVAEAVGAQPTGMSAPKARGPAAILGLRRALANRLRSTGGRPSLGVSRRQKIPLDDSDWDLLCKLARMLADENNHPTPGQVASVLVRQRLHQIYREIQKAEEGPRSQRKSLHSAMGNIPDQE